MASYAYDSGRNQRRTAVLIGIMIFHVIVIYAFANGLAQTLVQYIVPPLDTTLVEEKKVEEELPPPPPPELERPPVQIVAPEISISLTPDTPPPPITPVTPRPVVVAPRAIVASTPLGRVSGPTTEDYYPSSAKSAEQEGRPIIKVCVAANGRLESADVATTSGFPLLDEAAVRLAKASRWKAGTEAGKALATCGNLPIRFELKKSN